MSPRKGQERRRQHSRRRRVSGGRAQTSSGRCQKLRYTSREAAETAALLRAEGDPDYPDWLRVYNCPACLGWHLTSQPKRGA